MEAVSTPELVALHLSTIVETGTDAATGTTYDRSALGIGDVLDLDDTLSGRVELLSTLASMKEAGLVVENQARVAGLSDERNVYRLTRAGRDLARDVRSRLADESVAVAVDGETTLVPIDDLDEAVPDVPLVEALARTSDDGVLHRLDEGSVTDGIAGRQPELATIQESLAAVRAGAAETVVVSGESGIGKTTLVEHALDAARSTGVAVLSGAGNEDATEPYLPVRAALAAHRATAPSQLFEPDASPQAAEVVDPGDLADRREALFADVRGLLADLATDQPVALFLDDLHAADPGTLALVEYLATTLSDVRVLLIGAYRPEQVDGDHPLTRVLDRLSEGATHIALEPLDELATKSLIERTLDAEDVPRRFADTITEHTGGHPLFTEATVTHLREQGAVDPRTGHYPSDPAPAVPDRVQTMIDRRLDALDDTGRRVLSAGAVIGTTIPFDVLAHVTGLPETDLHEYVDLLVETRIWTHETDGTRTNAADGDDGGDRSHLAFATEVVRDAVREQLSDRQRRDLHETVARALERVYDDNLDGHAGTIAHHYERAGAPELAIEYYRRAGASAAAVYAHETAIDNYQRALGLARHHDHSEAVLSLLEAIGRVHFTAGEWDSADRYFEYLRERTDDPETLWKIAVYQVRIRADHKEFDAAIAVADEALAVWDGETADPSVCDLLNKKGWALTEVGKKREAKELIEAARDMADTLDDLEQRAKANHALAMVEVDLGNVDNALRLCEEALAFVERLGDEQGQGPILNNLGLIHLSKGDLDAAQSAFEQSLEIVRTVGNREKELPSLDNLTQVLVKRGEWEAARDRNETALELARELDARSNVAISLTHRGGLHLARGDLTAARGPLERALERFQAVEYVGYLATTHAQLAQLDLLQDDPDGALEHATEARSAVQGIDIVQLARACARQGQAYLALDRPAEALAAHDAGLAHAETCSSTEPIVWNRCGLANVRHRTGDLDQALDQATRAVTLADESAYALLGVEARIVLGRVLHARGALDDAETALQAAVADAKHLGATVHESEALYEVGRLYRTRGDNATASETLGRALALAETAGATLFERRCQTALADHEDDCS